MRKPRLITIVLTLHFYVLLLVSRVLLMLDQTLFIATLRLICHRLRMVFVSTVGLTRNQGTFGNNWVPHINGIDIGWKMTTPLGRRLNTIRGCQIWHARITIHQTWLHLTLLGVSQQHLFHLVLHANQILERTEFFLVIFVASGWCCLLGSPSTVVSKLQLVRPWSSLGFRCLIVFRVVAIIIHFYYKNVI